MIYIESTTWYEWSLWTSCKYKNGKEAECWKHRDDPPLKRRNRVCIKDSSGKEEVCKKEVEQCNELRTCPFGKITMSCLHRLDHLV